MRVKPTHQGDRSVGSELRMTPPESITVMETKDKGLGIFAGKERRRTGF